jgi:hypothetical protein
MNHEGHGNESELEGHGNTNVELMHQKIGGYRWLSMAILVAIDGY